LSFIAKNEPHLKLDDRCRRGHPAVGQNIDASFSHCNSMLEVGGGRAVIRNHCPAIAQQLHFAATHGDHRLDG
jgi:hypothetical protein